MYAKVNGAKLSEIIENAVSQSKVLNMNSTENKKFLKF